jgi:hypothetical protein
MAAPLNTRTTIEQRDVVRFLWAKNMDAAKDIDKEMLPIWAALNQYSLHFFGHIFLRVHAQIGVIFREIFSYAFFV